MRSLHFAAALLFALGMLLFNGPLDSCNMYKITVGPKTIVGNNEDNWKVTSQIWFEKGGPGQYGAVYVGYSDKPHPDGGMNEAGLAFDGFGAPERIPKSQPGKKDVTGIYDMRTVMQTCATIDEVC